MPGEQLREQSEGFVNLIKEIAEDLEKRSKLPNWLRPFSLSTNGGTEAREELGKAVEEGISEQDDVGGMAKKGSTEGKIPNAL